MLANLWETTKAIFFGLDWGFNPTHTQSAIRAAEIFLSGQKNHPGIDKIINESFNESNGFAWNEFQRDMDTPWDLQKFLIDYPKDSVGYEYAIFMNKLGYGTLSMNLAASVSPKVRSIIGLGVRNHDLVHFLFDLYDTDKDGKLSINDYHEWVFLFYTLGVVGQESATLPKILLIPSQIKAFVTFRYSEFQKAKKIGNTLSSAQNLNLMWLKPYFHKSVEQVRVELGIKTLDEVVHREINTFAKFPS